LDDDLVVARDRLDRPAALAGDVAEAALDRRRAARRKRHRRRGDEQRHEQEREERQQQRHGYTSILMTCRIQKKPIVCSTRPPTIMSCPIRSRNSGPMKSGLM